MSEHHANCALASVFSIALVVAASLVGFVCGAESDPTVQGAAESLGQVLLLRDGGVLTGNITQSGDRYVVARGGAEVSVPAANVAAVCSSLEDAYLNQRRAVQTPTTDAHLALADWCLQRGLYSQAADELLTARGRDPRHAKLELLERRLDAIMRQPQPTNATPTPAAVQPARSGESRLSIDAAGELPSGVVERFTRKVQPLLVNNCTTAGCHHPGGKQSFVLDRSLLHGMANRRSTTHNLSAVLALVDRERPQESRLLTIPRRDHGGMDHPIFGPRQSAQLQQLAEWVAMVTKSTAATNETAPSSDAGQAAESSAAPVAKPPRWREPIARVSYEEDGSLHVPSSVSEERLPPQRGAKVRAWQPKDPFDPEIFNRETRRAASPEDEPEAAITVR